jgi:glycosyltransferase involved in cell wall biosynthesis
LERALSAARRSLLGLSVTIDARCLAEPTTGTQVHVLEVIGALARETGVRLRIILPDRLHPDAATFVDGVPPTVERTTVEPDSTLVRSDVAHRPYQISSPNDVQELRRFGDRVVITQQDLIGYGNATYFSSDDAWERYRSLTRAALVSADRVVFFSDYVAREAVAEGLIPAREARVVRLGTDHAVGSGEAAVRPAALDGDDYIVCIGTDFVHKNRVFALAVCSELARRHQWTGSLVFAGSRVGAGSSAAAEASFLSTHSELDGRVVDLGRVTNGERRWLLEQAQLVLFPSVVEGFGLVPYEAARAGTPCAFASQGALAETLSEDAALIVPWDAAATAERVARALAVEAVADDLVSTILRAAEELTWENAARGLTAVYTDTASAPASATDGVSFASSPSLAMVEPLMPPDVQRAFAAVLVRPRARALLFRTLLLAQRVRQATRRLMSSR